MRVIALMACCAISALAVQSEPVTVKSVRFWSLGQVTRVAVELSGEGTYHSEKLEAPDRYFVDIFDAQLDMGGGKPQTIKVNDTLVRQIRVAKYESKTRVVIDLTARLDAEVSQLANPHRIMIEIRVPGAGKMTGPPLVSQSAPPSSAVQTEKTATSEKQSSLPPPSALPAKKSVEEPRTPALQSSAATTTGAAAPSPPQTTSSAISKPPEPVSQGVALASAPKPARPRAGGQQSMVRALGLKLGKVVIDPGHGGNDHGTTGPTGLLEKDLVLDVALKLGAMIEEKLGSEVIYTRSTDTFIPLEERTAMANDNKADLFISIHANSSPYKNISGAEVYYLNFTNSKDALEVAARENAGHGKSIFELRDLLQKIALKDKADESREFAGKVQLNLHNTWAKLNSSARNRGVKKAPFVVLIGASMPSVLAEVGFVSNPRDEQSMKKPEARARIADALFRGVQQYASTLSEMRVARSGEVSESH